MSGENSVELFSKALELMPAGGKEGNWRAELTGRAHFTIAEYADNRLITKNGHLRKYLVFYGNN